MNVSFVFNDASLPFKSLETCRQHLPVFFSILRKATKNEVHVIRTNENIGSNWYNIHYADGFSLSQWIEQRPDRDYKRYIRRIMDRTKCPLVSSDENEILDVLNRSEFTLADGNYQPVFSLGVAFLIETPAVSFCSMQRWKENWLAVVHNQFDGETDDVLKKDCYVENISQREHLSFFLKKLKEERQSSQDYLKGLVVSGNDDYKNLIFCHNVLRNFEQLGIHKSLLKKIKDVLGKLNSVIQVTESESYIKENLGLNISGESQTTKNTMKLIKHRNFKLPNGNFETFDLHVKNFPDGQRLYFLPDFKSKKIYIGYFGKHLPV
jgi:hypothetical protein